MLVIDHTVLSDDLVEQQFVCDLRKCRGACCVEGDLGAPLADEERDLLELLIEDIKPCLSPEGRAQIEKQGLYVFDEQGEFSTPVMPDGRCAYAIQDENGILKCGMEQAYQAGKTNFQKPISCHLYPVRITQYDQYDALNYDRWDICKAACVLGKSLKMPVYQFVREALIRKYGEAWYQELDEKAQEKLAQSE